MIGGTGMHGMGKQRHREVEIGTEAEMGLWKIVEI